MVIPNTAYVINNSIYISSVSSTRFLEHKDYVFLHYLYSFEFLVSNKYSLGTHIIFQTWHHLFHKYFLSSCYVPGIVIDAGNIAVNKNR